MATTNASTRSGVFFSYSHKDQRWLEKLQTMMSPLIRNNTISVWWDGKIRPSQKWRDEIDKALSAAGVGVLLVSPNFLASDFINRKELPYLLDAAKNRGVKLIWILLQYCLYDETPIRDYQAAHDITKPLGSLRRDRQNEVLVRICREIEVLLRGDDLTSPRGDPTATELAPVKTPLHRKARHVPAKKAERLRVLVAYGPWDAKWQGILSEHLDVPDQLGLLKYCRMPSAKVRSRWISEFKSVVAKCSAIVFLVSPDFLKSGLIADTEVGAIIEESISSGRPRILSLMTRACSGLRVPTWLPVPDQAISMNQRQGQSGQYQELLGRHAMCAKTATQVGALLKDDSICDSMSGADLVQFYRWRTRENILLSSTWINTPFHWDLFALPIRCQSYPERPRGAVNLRSEQLLARGGRHVLLLGTPGSGKTTACKRIEAYSPRGTIPLRLGSIIPQDVNALVERLSDRDVTGIKDKAFLKEQIRRGAVLLVADGISENQDVIETVTKLHVLTAQLPRIRYLVTCRIGTYREFGRTWFPRFRRWIIRDLTWQSQARFLAKQDKRVQNDVRQAFSRERELRQMCRNQFLFLMVVQRIADEGLKDFNPTRVGIYEDFLQDFLRRWERITDWERPTIENFLKDLAVDMRTLGPERSSTSRERVRELLRNKLNIRTTKGVETALIRLMNLGLLQRDGTNMRFFQETFQEFLCAKWVSEKCVIRFPINSVICSFRNEMAGFGKTVE